ncbi:MAG: M36 family metallopeptidase, partial [Kiritimatiellia bacterium]
GSNPDAGQDPDAAGYNGTTTGDVFRRGLVTQLFYVSNWYHDILYTLGFDEAAGNFQTENFDKGGAGGDEVQAEAQDGSGTDNANFSTPPDGEAGRMQMYLFTGPTPMRDGSLDTEVVTHELTHGLSNRLIANGAGLMWGVGGGMGEGWSDFYAMALLNNTNSDDPDAMYATGGYATYKMDGLTDNYLYGIRRFPYSTNNSINPLTWADVDDSTYDESGGIAVSPIGGGDSGAGEVHAMGEVWALTLWEMRSRIIADPAGANGDVPSGNMTALAIVTDGMKMTPANPSFIEARDAILAADAAANGSRNERWIWEGFADRGLGYNASAPYSRMGGAGVGHIGIGESFDIPYLDVGEVVVEDATLGNGNASLDPNETVDLVVRLKNPWLAAAHGVGSAQASLVAVTPGVTVLHPNSTYPAIPAGEEVGGSPFRVHVPAGASAGMPIRFEITVTSAMGTRKVDFTRRVGRRVGLGTPFVLTRTIPGGLDFMSGEPHGKTDSLTVSEDVEIADLDFRVDDLVHPWVGDVGVMLKGPAGLGTDLILDIGALANDFGAGENLKDTVIDDDAEDDLALAEEVSAPFTGSWKPVFNSNQWDVYGLASDTEGLLSRFNGTSSRGTWTVLVTDKGWFNDGTLNAWSLIITPARYEILPFAGKPDIVIERPAGGGFPRGGVQDFGLTAIGDSTTFDFIMKNVGTADLTSLDFSFDGPDAAMFSAIFSNPGRLRPGEEKAFTLVFSPLDVGMKTAAVHIASNDPDEDPYDMLVTGTGVAAPFDSPEIVVEQPAGVVFPDGGVKTFGNIFVGESKTLDFSLSNIGTVDLTGLQMNINGPDAAMFSVVTPPVAPVSPGGSTTFSLRFTPGKAGTCIAALQIANNDPNEAPFDIALRGVGLANPDLRLQFPAGNDRPAGATVHFGDVGIGAAAYLTFTIVNAGLDNLDGIGVSIDGPDAGLYQLVVPPAATLAPAGSTTFSILFSPLSPGFKQAALHIASNDPDENPFDLTLTGYRYTALEDWRKTHFGITNNTSIAANDADDDHDGIPNLVEFAFGLRARRRRSRPSCRSRSCISESASIQFHPAPGRLGITYGAEWNTVLSNAPGMPVTDSGVLPVAHLQRSPGPEPPSSPPDGDRALNVRFRRKPDFSKSPDSPRQRHPSLFDFRLPCNAPSRSASCTAIFSPP